MKTSSLHVVKAGLMDSFQDEGRRGHAALGINPGGVMDWRASRLANALVGNSLSEVVLELHFPASTLVFEDDVVVALCGADFDPRMNGNVVPMWKPVLLPAGTTLSFHRNISGSRCYLALRGGFSIDTWLGSKSTNLKIGAGGFQGRTLRRGDRISCMSTRAPAGGNWYIHPPGINKHIALIKGPEFSRITPESRQRLFQQEFLIDRKADRMGYHLEHAPFSVVDSEELVSSPVTYGTVQLLPDGSLIVLMADHQTTGGYPRIAHVAFASLPDLAQCRPGDEISFYSMTTAESEKKLLSMHREIYQIAASVKFKYAH